MSAARPQPALDVDFVEIGDQRRTDRRSKDRRTVRARLDPLFAATLVNQIAPAESARAARYVMPRRGPRAGLIINVRA